MVKEIDLSSIQDKIANKKVFLKIHSSELAKIYAFCDPELINKTLKSKKLNFFVNPDFYKGKLISLEEALKILSYYPNANVVGRLAYYASKVNIVDKRSILWIKDEKTNIRVPHILLMKI
ncbi:MAG: DUF424 family protein [Candidatus Thorarchaeota archaeon]